MLLAAHLALGPEVNPCGHGSRSKQILIATTLRVHLDPRTFGTERIDRQLRRGTPPTICLSDADRRSRPVVPQGYGHGMEMVKSGPLSGVTVLILLVTVVLVFLSIAMLVPRWVAGIAVVGTAVWIWRAMRRARRA